MPRLAYIHSLQRHGLADQLRDSGSSRAAAEEQEALVSDLLPGDTQCGEHPRQRYTSGALDIVVVSADLVAIARENRHGIDVREVLPLDAAFRV